MARYGIYIDGFNMYHALKEGYQQFLWLNYRKLLEANLSARDTIERIVYFSAHTYWKPASVARYREYIKALRSAQVEVILGKFKNTNRTCNRCKRRYSSHEEKRTDVNIALNIVQDAVLDPYDRAIIVSADSDLIPAIEMVHQLTPGKEVGVMLPVGRESFDLKAKADFRKKMSQKLLAKSIFPPIIQVGADQIHKPSRWP